jgi:hypothetical protein
MPFERSRGAFILRANRGLLRYDEFGVKCGGGVLACLNVEGARLDPLFGLRAPEFQLILA